jgi:hypothetical protein
MKSTEPASSKDAHIPAESGQNLDNIKHSYGLPRLSKADVRKDRFKEWGAE